MQPQQLSVPQVAIAVRHVSYQPRTGAQDPESRRRSLGSSPRHTERRLVCESRMKISSQMDSAAINSDSCLQSPLSLRTTRSRACASFSSICRTAIRNCTPKFRILSMIMTGISYFALLTRFVAMPRWNEIRHQSLHTSPANGTGTRSNDRLRVRRVVISSSVDCVGMCRAGR